MIWEELGSNIEGLFKMGRSGVIAALLAASKKLHSLEEKVCPFVAVYIDWILTK